MRDPVSQVRFVSNCLYGFSTFWLLSLLVVGSVDTQRYLSGKTPLRHDLIKSYSYLWGGPLVARTMGSRTQRPRLPGAERAFAMGLTGIAISAIANVVMLIGANRMRRLQNYPLACAAGVLAVIPHTAPFYLLGMFVGAFALWTLTRPEVRSAFADAAAQAQARTALEQQLVNRTALPYLLGVLAAMVVCAALNWVIGYVLLTQTEWGHRLAWPVTGYLGTVLSQICVFAGMYLYLRQRLGHYEAFRGSTQGPFYLLGVDDRRRTDARGFRGSVIYAGLIIAGPAAFFSFVQPSTSDALSYLNLIVVGSSIWGILASMFLTPGRSGDTF